MQGGVKTQASHRWMPLDRLLAEKLRQHKARLAPLAKKDIELVARIPCMLWFVLTVGTLSYPLKFHSPSGNTYRST